jgi:signal transduction histidine kinase
VITPSEAPSVREADPAAERLKEANRRLRSLLRFGREINAEHELKRILSLTARQLVNVPSFQSAAAVLVGTTIGPVEAVEVVGLNPEFAASWQQLTNREDGRGSELAEPLKLAQPVAYADDDPRLSTTGSLLRVHGIRRTLAVPLIARNEIVGLAIGYGQAVADLDRDDVEYVLALAQQAATAIQNARLYTSTQRELRRREALRRVVESISSELDLDTLLERVVASAVELLEADGGTMSLVERPGLARIRAVTSGAESRVGQLLTTGEDVIGEVLRTGEAVQVTRVGGQIDPSLPNPHGPHSVIGVPVVWQGTLIGVFEVFAQDPNRIFDERNCETLELLADHAAIAIENARLYGEVRARLAELSGLQAATAALVEELQPSPALRTVAEQALALSGAMTVTIELLRPGGRELEVQVAVGEHAADLTGMRIPVATSVPGHAVSSDQPQVLRATGRTPLSIEEEAVELTDARSLLVLPLRARGHALGSLSAFTHASNAFQARQVELLATFANQAAISLDNARVYAELQSRLDEMVGLQSVGTVLLEELDFERVLQAICEQVQKLTDAEGVGLAVLEEEGEPHLVLRTVVGPSAEVLRGARIPIDGSFAGEALRSNRPQRSEDAQHDPRGYRRSLVLGNTRSILSVPMKTRQRSVGVLSIYNKQGEGGFTERDAELATFFANQAAVAIENARLYEETREYAVVEERNRLARELHDSVTQSLFSVTLLSKAALTLWERDPGKARERLERAHEVAQGALAEMRALIFQLRPMALQDEGLVSALKKHLAALQSRDGLRASLQVDGVERRLPGRVEEAAFRIVQESLNNVVKHAQATDTRVEVRFGTDGIEVCTADNGLGFDPNRRARSRSLGMASMRERAQAVGGCLNVTSAPGQGTRVCAELPGQDAHA